MTLVALNDFARRQVKDSPFSHYEGTEEELCALIQENWENKKLSSKPGEPEVWEVRVPADGFYSGIVKLENGDELTGKYSSRRGEEHPRQSIYVKANGRQKLPAVSVDIICYSKQALGADDASTDADFEVVSINAHMTPDGAPIGLMVLFHNQFLSDGGTSQHYTPEEFYEKAREAFMFDKDHAMLAVE
jgi:hypothetical protein